MTGLPPLLVISGATATGKTGLALRLADELGTDGIETQIFSADSRQVYRGLDIGTAKVGAEDRARVPHHGLDLVDPDAPFSVADYLAAIRGPLEDLGARGGVAILAGGTGLYLRAVARGLDAAALPSDPAVRARVEAELTRDGVAAAAGRLHALAPGMAARIDSANPRRVARALEVAELAGDVAPAPLAPYPAPVTWIGLTVPADVHARWIADRARDQFAAGLVDEAAALRARFDPASPAFSAIGYREAWAVLDGALTVPQAIEQDARRNVQFAKRQRTWFRSEPGIEWLDPTERDPLPPALATARELLSRRGSRPPR